MKKILFLMLTFVFLQLYAQENFKSPVSEINFGSSNKKLTVDKLDISNPQSWEETEFEIKSIEPFYGELPSHKKIAFWNDRMYKVTLIFSSDVGQKFIQKLNQEYGKYQESEPSGSDTTTYWSKGKTSIFMLSSANRTTLFFTDDSQKEFYVYDLFHGIIFYLIVTIAGMFAIYLSLVWLITSYCNRCKTFNMKVTRIDSSNLKDYDPSFFSSSMHQDTTYVHKCSKCGNIRKDKYSGFWSWYRSKDL